MPRSAYTFADDVLDRLTDGSVFEEPWPDGCWVWMRGLNEKGYGRIDVSLDGGYASRRCHRVAYEAIVGPVPDGLVLDHLCRNRACWNPSHLEPVTSEENLARGAPNKLPTPEAARLGRERSSAVRKARTHCKHGHEYTKENTRRDRRDGSRVCRECQRIAALRRYHRLKRATAEAP